MVEHKIINGVEIQRKDLEEIIKSRVAGANSYNMAGVMSALTDEEILNIVNSEIEYNNFNAMIKAHYSTIFFRED